MIQEMESWFLSQPNIINKYFEIDIEKKLKGKNPMDISNPDEFLQELTKESKKGKYHKIRHGTDLLSFLDSSKLKNDFEEYRRLIEAIIKLATPNK